MCYYNGQKVTKAEFIELKRLEKAVRNYDFLDVGVHNGFNYRPSAVLIPNEDRSDFEIVQMEWGFIGNYIPNRAEAEMFRRRYTTLNAKAENLFLNEQGKRSMWADAPEKRRCLVLSTGIIESRHIFPLGKKGEPLKTAVKYPYQVGLKDREYFFFPGIWNAWTDKETGEHVDTFALITTEANALMKQIHNSKERMPTILNDDLAWEWMMTNPSKERLTEIALTQIPSRMMEACTIGKEYRTAGEVNAFEYPELPAIDMTYMDTEELLFDHWTS